MGHKTFTQLVKKSWSSAVSTAAKNLSSYRPQIIEALRSSIPDERSAAVAALNEGNDAAAHDAVIQLIDDPDELVRIEVAEYLEDLGAEDDVVLLLERVEKYPALRMLLTRALQSITGREDGLITEDDPPEKVAADMEGWRTYLADKGFPVS
ncbi:HEAT repeat domain-containing protein [Thermodesulfobacteriota bacterium]